MNGILESKFADYMRNGAIKQMHLQQLQTGRFVIQFELTWKQGVHTLITTRGKAREWASLDRLSRHLREQCGDGIDKLPIRLILAG